MEKQIQDQRAKFRLANICFDRAAMQAEDWLSYIMRQVQNGQVLF